MKTHTSPYTNYARPAVSVEYAKYTPFGGDTTVVRLRRVCVFKNVL